LPSETHQKEKLAALRTVISSFSIPTFSEDEQSLFMRYVDEFSPGTFECFQPSTIPTLISNLVALTRGWWTDWDALGVVRRTTFSLWGRLFQNYNLNTSSPGFFFMTLEYVSPYFSPADFHERFAGFSAHTTRSRVADSCSSSVRTRSHSGSGAHSLARWRDAPSDRRHYNRPEPSMPDTITTITKLINSPPGQWRAGGVLGGNRVEFLERVESVLNENTKLEIAVWLQTLRQRLNFGESPKNACNTL